MKREDNVSPKVDWRNQYYATLYYWKTAIFKSPLATIIYGDATSNFHGGSLEEVSSG